LLDPLRRQAAELVDLRSELFVMVITVVDDHLTDPLML
jgi:hypothetical protein